MLPFSLRELRIAFLMVREINETVWTATPLIPPWLRGETLGAEALCE